MVSVVLQSGGLNGRDHSFLPMVLVMLWKVPCLFCPCWFCACSVVALPEGMSKVTCWFSGGHRLYSYEWFYHASHTQTHTHAKSEVFAMNHEYKHLASIKERGGIGDITGRK